jgi:alkylated DNA repair dioxygenase AlkB
MNTLFPIEPVFPAGFEYFPNFITALEEQNLIAAISSLELHSFVFQGYTANRKVASFGYDYSFADRKLSKGKEIPATFDFLISRVARKLGVANDDFAELLVTEYPPGSVINWHRDAPPFDIIAGISLATDCKFRFRPQEKEKQNRASIISFTAERCSLYIMKDESRTEWQHSISPVKQTRYSITLRTLKI